MQNIRILLLVLVLSLCFACVGCNANKETETQKKQPVTINLAADDSVNGYRVESKTEQNDNGMPDVIKSESVGQYVDSSPATNIVVKDETSEITSAGYCANKNSKIFHKIECGSVSKMKDENKEYYSNREELISKGYKPCKSCAP